MPSPTPTLVRLDVALTGTGAGAVTSIPAGIACAPLCRVALPRGAGVTLTAVAAPGSTFTGWSGGGCTGRLACAVTLTADTTVSAAFTRTPPENLALTVRAPASIGTGDPFALTWTVRNTGPTTAPGSVLRVTLDPQVVLAGPLPQGCSLTGAVAVTCALGALAPGSSTSVDLLLRSRVVGADCDVWGTSRPDRLVDRPGQDTVLCGLGGDDQLEGLDGADTLFGDAPPGARPFVAGFAGQVTTTLTEPDLTDNRRSVRLPVTLAAPGVDLLSCGAGDDRFGSEPTGSVSGCEALAGTAPPVLVPPVVPPVQPPVQPVDDPGPVAEPVASPAPSAAPSPAAPSPAPSPAVPEFTGGAAEAALDAPSALPGGVTRIAGSGCPAGAPVTLAIGGTSVGTATADQNGDYDAQLTVPELPIGRHTVQITCGPRSIALPIDLVVSSASATGPASVTTVGLVLLIVVLLGALLLQNSGGPVRRREPEPEL